MKKTTTSSTVAFLCKQLQLNGCINKKKKEEKLEKVRARPASQRGQRKTVYISRGYRLASAGIITIIVIITQQKEDRLSSSISIFYLQKKKKMQGEREREKTYKRSSIACHSRKSDGEEAERE